MTTQTQVELQATPRSVLGKRVRAMRRQGLTPANIYGHNVPSLAIQLDTNELIRTLRHVPRTALMRLAVQGEAAPRPVLIRQIQRHPVDDAILHVDFYQVSMTEKMRTEVPVHVVGSTPAIDDLGGILVQELNTVEVECLPADIPAAIEVDLSKIEAIGESLHIRDLMVPANVTVHGDPDAVVARVAAPELEEEAEAAEAEAAAEEGEAEAGE